MEGRLSLCLSATASCQECVQGMLSYGYTIPLSVSEHITANIWHGMKTLPTPHALCRVPQQYPRHTTG